MKFVITQAVATQEQDIDVLMNQLTVLQKAQAALNITGCTEAWKAEYDPQGLIQAMSGCDTASEGLVDGLKRTTLKIVEWIKNMIAKITNWITGKNRELDKTQQEFDKFLKDPEISNELKTIITRSTSSVDIKKIINFTEMARKEKTKFLDVKKGIAYLNAIEMFTEFSYFNRTDDEIRLKKQSLPSLDGCTYEAISVFDGPIYINSIHDASKLYSAIKASILENLDKSLTELEYVKRYSDAYDTQEDEMNKSDAIIKTIKLYIGALQDCMPLLSSYVILHEKTVKRIMAEVKLYAKHHKA